MDNGEIKIFFNLLLIHNYIIYDILFEKKINIYIFHCILFGLLSYLDDNLYKIDFKLQFLVIIYFI